MKSTVAQAAQQIRKILKEAYPDIKFSVRSESFSMGDAVRVSYEDGVPTKKIEELIGHYQQGNFDGMTDCYNYDNSRDDIPQTKFLTINRDLSEEAEKAVKAKAMKYWGIKEWTDQVVKEKTGDWTQQLFWDTAKEMTF